MAHLFTTCPPPGADHAVLPLGTEANLTVRYILSRRTLLQGHAAATFAGRAVEDALGTSSAPC
jgi:hypothetical protein